MGLDMYIDQDVRINAPGKIVTEHQIIHASEIEFVTISMGYWRKANAIHHWFVQNVQDGVDDCGRHYVPRAKLEELLSIVKQVLKKPKSAPTLLPTQQGFFFGCYEYDEFYIYDLKKTKKILKKCLKNPNSEHFHYQSSW